MKKLFLFLGTILLIVGALVIVLGVSNGNGGKSNMIEKEYDLTENFENIEIDTDTADIELLKSDVNRVEVVEREKEYHTVDVRNNKLIIKSFNLLKWYERIFYFSFKKMKVTVYLTETSFDELKINESTGDIRISEGFKFKNANIDLSTGDVSFKANVTDTLVIDSSTGDINVENINGKMIKLDGSTGKVELKNCVLTDDLIISRSAGDIRLSNIRADNLKCKTSTGDYNLYDVVITNHINIKASTGNIVFDNIDAASLYFETSTGKVSGYLLSEKVFTVDTSTGKVNVPKTQSGGLCEVHTSTGRVDIEIK